MTKSGRYLAVMTALVGYSAGSSMARADWGWFAFSALVLALWLWLAAAWRQS